MSRCWREVRSTELLRFVGTYRWELWLIVGIPVTTAILQALLWVPVVFLFGSYDETPNQFLFLANVLTLLLLAVSYLRVRRLGRDFLALVWGYVVMIGVISTIAAGAALIVGIEYPTETPLSDLGRTFFIYGLAALSQVLALLWFARQASRLSLTHALFLVAFASLTLFGPVHMTHLKNPGTVEAYMPFVVGGIITLSVMLLKVWLLGNFDLRGPGFRRNAIIGLVTATILSGYVRVLIGELFGLWDGTYSNVIPLLGAVYEVAAFVATTVLDLLALSVLFGLVYLVRVRQSSVDAPTGRADDR